MSVSSHEIHPRRQQFGVPINRFPASNTAIAAKFRECVLAGLRHRPPFWFFPCCAVAMAGFLAAAPKALAAPPPSPAEPKLAGSTIIMIDRRTGTGKQEISLQNPSASELPILLTTVINSAKPSNLRVLLAENTSDPGKVLINVALKPGAVQAVWVIAEDAWDPGDTSVDLNDKDTKIGTIKIRRLPFTLKLDGPAPDRAEVSLLQDVETRIALKNDDPVPYSLDWQLFVDGRIVCRGAGLPVEANGYGVLICNSDNIPFRFRHLLKDETLNGTLLISDKGFPSPLKIFPVSATAYTLGPEARHFWRFVIVFIVLAMGGVLSLILNQTLPNRIQKLDLEERLRALAKTTADLSTHLDSRLAVLVRIQWTTLKDLIRSRSTIFPEFASVAKLADDGLTKLNSRVKLLQQMDIILDRLSKVTPHGVPPSLIDRVNHKLGAANVFLGKADCSDADVQAAKTALDEASALVDSLEDLGADFEQALIKRTKVLAADVTANFESQPAFQKLNAAVPGPWNTVKNAQSEISADIYASLDMALQKVKLMREYTSLAEGTRDQEMLARLASKESALTGYLQLDSWGALNSAELLMREMQEDVYSIRLREALKNGEVTIQMDPAVAYDRAPLTFHVVFKPKAVNDAAAREEWTCNWDFGDGLTAVGLEVSHYYDLKRLSVRKMAQIPVTQKGKPFKSKLRAVEVTVKATFLDENGHKLIKPETSDELNVSLSVSVIPSETSKSWERTLTEGMKLGAALLIAIFGLVAGAGDQVSKLDVLPGLVAVFLLGFGADTIKNVLSPK
jgi:hypothetical protein